MRVVAAILAAGKGERFGGDKVTALLGGKPVWRWSFDSFVNHPRVDAVGLVVGRESKIVCPEAAFVVTGGANRQESSKIAVEASHGDMFLVHDAARPFVTPEVISRVVEATVRVGAAAPAIAVSDTLRLQGSEGFEVIDRSKTVAMQTPQGAIRSHILAAHRAADALYTDELALIGASGYPFEIVEGDPNNFKITSPADLARARAMLGGPERRTGFGYDIHPFSKAPGRPLMLGGVLFEGTAGLEGHSDADVVIHAVVDALLGAAGLGDIGQHFPNTDARWLGEPSLTFLKTASELLAQKGWSIVNVDITVIAEKPKVMLRAGEVRATLASSLRIEAGRVSFKATTNEGLGSLGRAEGIAAHAVATIQEAV